MDSDRPWQILINYDKILIDLLRVYIYLEVLNYFIIHVFWIISPLISIMNSSYLNESNTFWKSIKQLYIFSRTFSLFRNYSVSKWLVYSTSVLLESCLFLGELRFYWYLNLMSSTIKEIFIYMADEGNCSTGCTLI